MEITTNARVIATFNKNIFLSKKKKEKITRKNNYNQVN